MKKNTSHTLHVNVDWCDKNYGASIEDTLGGTIVVTAKTREALDSAIQEAIDFHIEGLVADGDKVPQWLLTKQYTLQYQYTISALLQQALQYTTLAALSRVTGIKHAQLSHYANAVSHPQPQQSQRIYDGLQFIGNQCLYMTCV